MEVSHNHRIPGSKMLTVVACLLAFWAGGKAVAVQEALVPERSTASAEVLYSPEDRPADRRSTGSRCVVPERAREGEASQCARSGCEPRDLIQRCADLCKYENRPMVLSNELLYLAWKNYFGAAPTVN